MGKDSFFFRNGYFHTLHIYSLISSRAWANQAVSLAFYTESEAAEWQEESYCVFVTSCQEKAETGRDEALTPIPKHILPTSYWGSVSHAFPRDLTKRQMHSRGLEWGLRLCIAKKLPPATASGSGTTPGGSGVMHHSGGKDVSTMFFLPYGLPSCHQVGYVLLSSSQPVMLYHLLVLPCSCHALSLPEPEWLQTTSSVISKGGVCIWRWRENKTKQTEPQSSGAKF